MKRSPTTNVMVSQSTVPEAAVLSHSFSVPDVWELITTPYTWPAPVLIVAEAAVLVYEHFGYVVMLSLTSSKVVAWVTF